MEPERKQETSLAVAILAGGASRRMGRDKASLPVDGGTLLERTAHIATEALPLASLMVVGREQPDGWAAMNAVFLPDPPERQGEGPLGGILTALEAVEERGISAILAVACDMPRLTPDALRWLANAAENATAEHGLVTLAEDGQPEPLFAVYRIAALPHLRACLSEGERSPRRAIARGDFARLTPPPDVVAALANVNTPEEWAAAVRASKPS
jgi:molybdenum cofactor guanylyltransferase